MLSLFISVYPSNVANLASSSCTDFTKAAIKEVVSNVFKVVLFASGSASGNSISSTARGTVVSTSWAMNPYVSWAPVLYLNFLGLSCNTSLKPISMSCILHF